MSINLEYVNQCFDKSIVENLKKCFFELNVDISEGFAQAFSSPYNIPISAYRNHTVTSLILSPHYVGNRPVGSIFVNTNCDSPDLFVVIEKTDGVVVAFRFCDKSIAEKTTGIMFWYSFVTYAEQNVITRGVPHQILY